MNFFVFFFQTSHFAELEIQKAWAQLTLAKIIRKKRISEHCIGISSLYIIRNIVGNQIQIFKSTNFLYYLDGKALSSHSSARTCANFAFILHYLNELWIGSTRILARVKTDHDCGISYSFLDWCILTSIMLKIIVH